MKVILYIATVISIVTYMFWEVIPIKDIFYYGNAMFIFLLCTYIFFTDKKSNIKFFLFSLSLSNLFDELFFDNTKIGLNEYLVLLFVSIIIAIRIKHDKIQ